MPSYEESKHKEFKYACYLVLECALGELAASENVHYLEVGPLPEKPEKEGYIELVELLHYIEWRKHKLTQP